MNMQKNSDNNDPPLPPDDQIITDVFGGESEGQQYLNDIVKEQYNKKVQAQ